MRPMPMFEAWAPCSIAFLASFAVMMVEIVAGRRIAEHMGASLYTWTSVIGIVLAGITVGNLIGGRIADRFPSRPSLAVLLIASALGCISIPFLEGQVSFGWVFDQIVDLSWPTRVAIHVAVAFFLPTAALGLVGPVTACWALEQGRGTGRTVGRVYASGALGSIAGTFAAGLWLVTLLGSRGTVLLAGAVLAAAAIAVSPRSARGPVLVAWPIAFALVIGQSMTAGGIHREWSRTSGAPVVVTRSASGRLHAVESQYSSIRVVEDTRQGILELHLDNLVHAKYRPGQIERLEYPYERIYASLTRRFASEAPRTFFIGGGGYVFPRWVKHAWPAAYVEVAEIDPAVTEACFAALGLDRRDVFIAGGPGAESPRARADRNPNPIVVHHLDARNRIEELTSLYRSRIDFVPFDIIYGDAFNDYSVPFHLVTEEFTLEVRELLRERSGLYLINVIDVFASGRFLGAVRNTLLRVFPRVYVISTNKETPNRGSATRDTFIVVGAQEDLDLDRLGNRAGELPFTGGVLGPEAIRELDERSGGTVLRDEYSPVENLLENVVRIRTR
jgi:spermidine synthase